MPQEKSEQPPAERRVFVLMGFRKNGDHMPIASDTDHLRIHNLCKELNRLAGRQDPAEGMWDREEIKASFTVQELYGDAPKDLERGLDFMNYEMPGD